MIAMMESVTIRGTAHLEPSGRIGRLTRRTPDVPIFSSRRQSLADAAVGASTCAAGSHVLNGNIGTLMAKPTKKARNTHFGKSSVRYGAMAWNASTLNVEPV